MVKMIDWLWLAVMFLGLANVYLIVRTERLQKQLDDMSEHTSLVIGRLIEKLEVTE